MSVIFVLGIVCSDWINFFQPTVDKGEGEGRESRFGSLQNWELLFGLQLTGQAGHMLIPPQPQFLYLEVGVIILTL